MLGSETSVSLMSPGMAWSRNQIRVRKMTKRIAICTRRPAKNLNIPERRSFR